MCLIPIIFFQTHLVCTVPPYLSQDIIEPTIVQIYILSGGKKSETHNFTYTPKNSHTALTAATTTSSYFNGIQGSILKQNSSNSHSQGEYLNAIANVEYVGDEQKIKTKEKDFKLVERSSVTSIWTYQNKLFSLLCSSNKWSEEFWGCVDLSVWETGCL